MSGKFQILGWVIFMMASGAIAILIMVRCRRNGTAWGAISLFGGALTWLFFAPLDGAPESRWVGLIGFALFGMSCFGLIRIRPPAGRCSECNYDFAGLTIEKSMRCPECGTVRAAARGLCLECGHDVSQALAGGSIKCPTCGEAIATTR